VRVGARSSLSINLTRVSGSSSGTSAIAYLTIPLETHRIASISANHRSGQLDAYGTVTQGLQAETGLGWRLLSGMRSDDPYAEGSVYYQGNRGLFTADAASSRDRQALRLGTQGALVWIDGRAFAARRVDSSFAVVEVKGYPNVGVGFQGTPLTRTDSEGYALLPRLQPYQRNHIRLDATELPISAEIDNLEQIAVPSARSGVKVTFPVRSGRGALIRIVLDDGEPAPAGAQIALLEDGKEFFVARRGEAFVTGLQDTSTLRLVWNNTSCTFTITLPPGSADDIARVGPVACKGVPRN
jgi:outer membrane usher protein